MAERGFITIAQISGNPTRRREQMPDEHLVHLMPGGAIVHAAAAGQPNRNRIDGGVELDAA
jgi:hypothetical protein